MPKISHKVHVTIDYLSVVVFAAVPTLLGFSGADAVLCYGLAAAHLMVTVSTAAPGGLLHWIPNRVHGGIEVLVGVTLLLGAGLTGAMFTDAGRLFFAAVGVTLLALWTISDHGHLPKDPVTE